MDFWDKVTDQYRKEYQKAFESALNKHASTSNGKSKTCPKCGAPIISEICPYCGTVTDIDTANSFMEYPVMECKTAALNKTLMIVLIVAVLIIEGTSVSAFIPAVIGALFALSTTDAAVGFVVLISAIMAIPGFIIGLIPGYFALKHYRRYKTVMDKGERLKGTVYGYMDDIVLVNNVPAQIVKILVQTDKGPRFILYHTGKTEKPYRVNFNIDLMVYEEWFIILKEG